MKPGRQARERRYEAALAGYNSGRITATEALIQAGVANRRVKLADRFPRLLGRLALLPAADRLRPMQAPPGAWRIAGSPRRIDLPDEVPKKTRYIVAETFLCESRARHARPDRGDGAGGTSEVEWHTLEPRPAEGDPYEGPVGYSDAVVRSPAGGARSIARFGHRRHLRSSRRRSDSVDLGGAGIQVESGRPAAGATGNRIRGHSCRPASELHRPPASRARCMEAGRLCASSISLFATGAAGGDPPGGAGPLPGRRRPRPGSRPGR